MSISGKKAAGGPAAETAKSFSEETFSENLHPQHEFVFKFSWAYHESSQLGEFIFGHFNYGHAPLTGYP